MKAGDVLWGYSHFHACHALQGTYAHSARRRMEFTESMSVKLHLADDFIGSGPGMDGRSDVLHDN
jgi:hypothetical protein